VNEVGIAAAMHPAAFAARMPFRESSITIHSSALAPNPRIALSKASGSDFGFEKPDQSTMKSKLFSRPNKERAARRLGGVVEVANAIRYLARAHSTNSGSRNSAVSPVRFRNHFLLALGNLTTPLRKPTIIARRVSGGDSFPVRPETLDLLGRAISEYGKVVDEEERRG
jgi:hypothetical protein